MAKRQDVRALLSKQLGPDVTKTLLDKVERMRKQGASAEKIEKAFMTDLTREIEKRVSNLIGMSVNAPDAVRVLVAVGRGSGMSVQTKK